MASVWLVQDTRCDLNFYLNSYCVVDLLETDMASMRIVNDAESNLIVVDFLFFSFQTPFVRQNTPHPKELKMKAHKLFSKKQDGTVDTLSEEVSRLIRT